MLFRRNHNITSEHHFEISVTYRTAKSCSGARRELSGGLAGCGPALRFNIGKDRVAQLDGFQLVDPLGRNLVSRFKAPPDVEQGAELLKMSIEALFRVVAR